jgi:hypothetical protein
MDANQKRLVAALFGAFAFSLTAGAETFRILGKEFVFLRIDGVSYSENCKAQTCEAYRRVKATRPADLKGLASEPRKMSPGSFLCSRVWKESSVLGRDSAREGRAFCLFSDRSFVELNSVSHLFGKPAG